MKIDFYALPHKNNRVIIVTKSQCSSLCYLALMRFSDQKYKIKVSNQHDKLPAKK